MHCVRFEMRLNQLLDERSPLDADRELAAHAHECPECADLLSGHELLLEAVDGMAAPSVGADFAVRVAAASTARTGRAAWSPWLWSIPVAAAALLIALGLWRAFDSPGENGRSPENDVVKRLPREAAGAGPRATDNPYVRIYRRTAQLTEEIRGRRMEWVNQMADGLKPVAESMSAALQALRRTFPGGDPAVRSSRIRTPSLGEIETLA